jgi:hypothetical protein
VCPKYITPTAAKADFRAHYFHALGCIIMF